MQRPGLVLADARNELTILSEPLPHFDQVCGVQLQTGELQFDGRVSSDLELHILERRWIMNVDYLQFPDTDGVRRIVERVVGRLDHARVRPVVAATLAHLHWLEDDGESPSLLVVVGVESEPQSVSS